MAKGRVDEAERILADLEATDLDDPYIITQSKDIQWAVQYEKDHAVRWRDLLRGRTGDQAGTHTIRRVILGMGTQAMQQLCKSNIYHSSTLLRSLIAGINVTSYYLPTVLIESVGLSNNLARLLAACNSVSYLLFSLIGIPNVERWGRRKMMMYAAAGQCFCYTIITICLRYSDSSPVGRQWASGSIAFFFLYYVFFGIGWQGVPWVSFRPPMQSLVLTASSFTRPRSTPWLCERRALLWEQQRIGKRNNPSYDCIANIATRIFNFMVVEITPPGIRSLGWRFYIIWCVFNFAFIPTGKCCHSTCPSQFPNCHSLLLLPRDGRAHARRSGPLLRWRCPTACLQG